jgi:hypothetical protein
MRVGSAPKKRAQMSMIYLTFFLLLSIPIIIFGIAQDDFDTRKRAFQDLELSEEYPCLISFPNVNPYSLEINRNITVQVDAAMKDVGISGLEVENTAGVIIHEEVFEGAPIEIGTSFTYSPERSGKANLTGTLYTIGGTSVTCEMTSPYGIQGLEIVSSNKAPNFTTRPSQSIPSQNITTGDTYEYTLEATDTDGDRINYSYSFTPRADWLRETIIEDGSGGNLTIKFSGKADKPASYLANIFIHDGYSRNLKSQSWIINVSPSENDIPVVTIIDPAETLRIDEGTTFKTSWEATDLNHITGYKLFITDNPANESEWIAIDGDIPYDKTSYNVNTSDLESGTYKLITQATDNQDPPGTGKGVSPEIVISSTDGFERERDDEVIISQPQVINMVPMSTDEITNKRVTVKATIVAGENAEIDESTIVFKLNNLDFTNEIRINKISEREFTLIYQPETDLEGGLNKGEVTFSDTNGQDVTKSWNFTIQGEDSNSENTYTILGYDIAKNIVHIIGIGVITVILALVAPFVIFSIWKEDSSKEDPTKHTNTKLPPSIPTDDTMYSRSPSYEDSEIKVLVDSTSIQEEQKNIEAEDVWDKYSAPKPQTEEQRLPEKNDETPSETAPPMEIITEETEIKEEMIPTETLSGKTPAEKETLPPPQPEQETQEDNSNKIHSIDTMPEPEIPDIAELEKLSEQLRKIKENEQNPTDN